MSGFLPAVLLASGAMLAIGLAFCIARFVRGPSAFDRILAFDCAVLHMLGGLLVLSVAERSAAYLDVVLVVGLLGFAGTVALAAYLEGTLGD